MIGEDRDGVVVVHHAGIDLAHYVHTDNAPQGEAPKPYLHPLRTLAGDVVTGYRPHDHRWHKGLQLTCTDLSGTNLWGGHTWVDGVGYSLVENLGRMDVAGPVETTSGRAVTIAHDLAWRSAAGEELVRERRSLTFSILEEVKAWSLHWASTVTNTSGAALTFGSPATLGHVGSGYSGLTWRGPRAFTGGRVLVPGGEISASEARGARAPWLAFCGDHDEVDRSSTIVFEPLLEDERYETRWFVRSEEFATVNPSWAYERPFVLGGESMSFSHRIMVADGELTVADVERMRGEIAAA